MYTECGLWYRGLMKPTSENPKRVQADQERRRSHAAGAHDSRPHRQRSRAAAKRAAVADHR